MTRPINLYIQSRIESDLPFNRVASHRSQKNKRSRIKSHEIASLRLLVDRLVALGVTVKELDGFFYGYSIPQIGKEFDLLKINEKACLSIELKSRAVSKRKILEQLKKNEYYLGHLAKKTSFFTVVTDSMTVYKLDESGRLIQISVDKLALAVKSFCGEYIDGIDDLFKVSAFLVSPLSTPEKFLKGEYFLTTAQQQKKREMIRRINKSEGATFLSITGRSGTGKTLLLYDMAKELSKRANTLIIHGAVLDEKTKGLDLFGKALKLVDIDDVTSDNRLIEGYKCVFVDESHRISPDILMLIINRIKASGGLGVFSSDTEQAVTKTERGYKADEIISRLCGSCVFNLSERIRTNKALSAFITSLKDLKKRAPKDVDFNEVSLCFANTDGESKKIIDYYESEGYVFIDYSEDDERPLKNRPVDARFVVGMEFEKVVMLMDDRFYYDGEGVLNGVPTPSSDYLYPNLFYQGITRVRQRLAIVVLKNQRLFSKITSIVDRTGEKRKNG